MLYICWRHEGVIAELQLGSIWRFDKVRLEPASEDLSLAPLVYCSDDFVTIGARKLRSMS